MTATEKFADGTVPSGSFVTGEPFGVEFAWVVVELAPAGILVSDDGGRILMANREVENLFGYGRDTLVGAQVDSLLAPRSRQAHRARRSEYAAAPTARSLGIGRAPFGCHADGSEFPIEINVSRVATVESSATVVVIRDVRKQRANQQVARATLIRDDNERVAAGLPAAVINHVFRCGLDIASVLGSNPLENAVSERLYDVIDELDAVIREIHHDICGRR
jgi:PAS domain S-box-containing protein